VPVINNFIRKGSFIKIDFKKQASRFKGIISSIPMTLINAAGTNYKIQTEIYNGPLDLLLKLISESELDITRVSLAKVTDQYLDHLKDIQNKSAIEVSGFLIIAAKLIQIKSEAILPRPLERQEGEDDPAENLARQLKIYRAIKQSAGLLQALEENGHRTYIRLVPPPVINEIVDLDGLDIDDLAKYLKNLYRFEEEASPVSSIVTIPKITIKQKIRDLINRMRENDEISYQELLYGKKDRIEAIVLFLSILELIKQNFAVVTQTSIFGDIRISPTEKIHEETELNLVMDE